jgi:hypothetical protein
MPCVNDAFLGPTFREEPGSARRGEGQIEMKRSSASPCSWVRVLVLVLCSACSGRAEDGLPACPGADGTPGSGRLGTPAAGCVTRSLSCGVACVTGGCGVASDAEIACSSNLLSENSLEVAPSASVTYVGISQIGWARPFAIESNRIQEIEGLSFGAGVSALLVSVGADGSAHWARDHHPSGDSALAEGVVHVYPSGAGWQTEFIGAAGIGRPIWSVTSLEFGPDSTVRASARRRAATAALLRFAKSEAGATFGSCTCASTALRPKRSCVCRSASFPMEPWRIHSSACARLGRASPSECTVSTSSDLEPTLAIMRPPTHG